jgi:hypothetical protein
MPQMKGDIGPGDMQTLASGIMVSWAAGGNKTIITVPTDANGVLVTLIAVRSVAGAQPLTYTIGANGQAANLVSAIAPPSIGATVAALLQPAAYIIPAAATVIATPLTTTAGSAVFDAFGIIY